MQTHAIEFPTFEPPTDFPEDFVAKTRPLLDHADEMVRHFAEEAFFFAGKHFFISAQSSSEHAQDIAHFLHQN